MPSPVEPIQLPTWLFVLVVVLPALVSGVAAGLSGWLVTRAKDLREEKKRSESQQREAVAAISASLRSLFELVPWEDDPERLFTRAADFHRTVDGAVDVLPNELRHLTVLGYTILRLTKLWRAFVATVQTTPPQKSAYSHVLNKVIDETYTAVIEWRTNSPNIFSDPEILNPARALIDFMEAEMQRTRSVGLEPSSSG